MSCAAAPLTGLVLGFATTHSGMASGDGESEGAPPFDEEERRRELGELRPFKLQKLCAEQGPRGKGLGGSGFLVIVW